MLGGIASVEGEPKVENSQQDLGVDQMARAVICSLPTRSSTGRRGSASDDSRWQVQRFITNAVCPDKWYGL